MNNVSYHGSCSFNDNSSFDDFKRDLKTAFRNSDLHDVTVNGSYDEVIVVFEWANNTSDLEVSHIITRNVVQRHGGEYRPSDS